MATQKSEAVDMASETVAGDLLAALVQELKVLPDIWPKLPEHEQNEIIDRVRRRVGDNVRKAVRLIASEKRVTVAADLKKVVFGEHIEAVFTIAARDPSRLELADSRGQACLIVVTDAGAHMGGLDDVKGDPDQRDLPLSDGAAVIEQARRRSKRNPPDASAGEAKPNQH
jgi:hypothetical protein